METTLIASRTDPNTSYVVSRDERGGMVCSCSAYAFGGFCAHLALGAEIFGRRESCVAGADVLRSMAGRLEVLAGRMTGSDIDAWESLAELNADINSLSGRLSSRAKQKRVAFDAVRTNDPGTRQGAPLRGEPALSL